MMRSKGFIPIELGIVKMHSLRFISWAVPGYKIYTKKAMATGIKALLGAVLTAQRVYYSEFSHFASGSVSAMLGITPTANKYFRSFSITGNTTAFTAKTAGTVPANGITIKIRATKTGPYFTEFGL